MFFAASAIVCRDAHAAALTLRVTLRSRVSPPFDLLRHTVCATSPRFDVFVAAIIFFSS